MELRTITELKRNNLHYPKDGYTMMGPNRVSMKPVEVS